MAVNVVAGGTGRVGSVVAAQLLARGANVRVIVRDRERGAKWVQRGAEAAVGSFEDSAFMTGALRDAASFFTLLPENPLADDFHGYRRGLADSIAAAVQASRAPRVVMLSASPASLAEGNGPPKDLHYMENALRATGTILTALRASYFQENIASALPAANQAGVFPNFLPSADFAFPMIATSDVGRFAADALLAPATRSEVIDLFGPSYSMRQLADKLGAALGKTLRVVDIPAAAHVTALVDAGLPRPFAEAIAEMWAAFVSGRVVPAGERSLTGTTTVDETLVALLAQVGK